MKGNGRGGIELEGAGKTEGEAEGEGGMVEGEEGGMIDK